MYNRIQPYDVIQAVLQQEVVLYCGRLIATNPEMFKGILKIRVGCVNVHILNFSINVHILLLLDCIMIVEFCINS